MRLGNTSSEKTEMMCNNTMVDLASWPLHLCRGRCDFRTASHSTPTISLDRADLSTVLDARHVEAMLGCLLYSAACHATAATCSCPATLSTRAVSDKPHRCRSLASSKCVHESALLKLEIPTRRRRFPKCFSHFLSLLMWLLLCRRYTVM